MSDDGRTVTTSADKHACYADRDLIEQSNAILRAKKSGVNITPGGAGPSGQAPDGSGVKSTVKVEYHILSDEDNEDFYADCGVSSREVQGPTGTDTRPRGVYTDSAGSRTATTRSYDPGDFRDEIYMAAGLGSTQPRLIPPIKRSAQQTRMRSTRSTRSTGTRPPAWERPTRAGVTTVSVERASTGTGEA